MKKYYNSVHEFRQYTYIGFDCKEKWKYIKKRDGSDSNYQISNFGNIRNKKTKKLLSQCHKKDDNHHIISLRLEKGQKRPKTYSVHRLVAKYFMSNPKNKPQVHHIDGDPNNNFYKNLMWVTASEHMKLSYELEQRDRKFCEASPNAKYTLDQYMKLGKLLEENELKPSELSKETGISVVAILAFVNGETLWPPVREKYDISKYDKMKTISLNSMELAFKLISENNLTIEEIMKETSISRTTISDIINGKVSEKWKYLLDIYDVTKFNNFSLRKKVIDDITREQVKDMINSGFKTSEIISKLNLDKNKYTYTMISQYRRKK